MDSSGAASTSTSTVTLPSSLAFLVSNFHALVNLKLDSGNYLLWRTQVMNALRANGYIEYLDSTKPSPEPTIVDSSNPRVRLPNPEFVLWTLIDNQLLSCVTSSLSSTTLSHVLGLTHVCQVWDALEHRLNSLSKSRIHELKNKLYTVKLKGSMDEYIDEIRGYEQQLQAVGYHVDDDDLVFYALKGLPEEYRPVRSALNAKGDIMFGDLATVLKNEESQILRDEGKTAPKVFLANQKFPVNMIPSQSYSFTPGGQEAQMVQNGNLGTMPQFYQAPMYQTSQSSGSFFPEQSNRGYNFGQNSKGAKRNNFGPNNKVECQICGKTNHIALYCYHRQNLQYQPPSFQSSNSRRGVYQNWNGSSGPMMHNATYNSVMPHNNFSAPRSSGSNGQNFLSNAIGTSQANMVTFPNTVPINFNATMGHQVQGGQGAVTGPVSSPQGFMPSQAFITTSPVMNTAFSVNEQMTDMTGHTGGGQASPNWFFDSGASNHVTNNLNNLSQSQSCYTGEGVLVGNGASLSVNHSGQTHTSHPPQGTMCGGVVSCPDLL